MNKGIFSYLKKYLISNGIIGIMIIGACGNNSQQTTQRQDLHPETNIDMEKTTFPYNLQQPSKTIYLPQELNEISGIAWINKESLAGVQDEKGIIYHIELERGNIIERYHFEKSGDFEDLVIKDDDAIVIRSDGQFFSVKNYRSENRKTTQIETSLSIKNDVEGLCFSPKYDQLLLACKGDAGIGKNDDHLRAIYSTDLPDFKFKREALYTINLEEIGEKAGIKKIQFAPSALAFHPITGELYILSHVGKILLIMTPNGELQSAKQLSPKIFAQPEGICFSPDGTLYISNEGKDSPANILVFEAEK